MSTRDDILAAARDAFEAGGEAGLSVRDIAGRVGVTPMAIYRHFENKQAIIDALVAEATFDWRKRVAAIPACAPEAWLEKIGDAFLDFALSEPRRFEAAFFTISSSALRYPDDFIAAELGPLRGARGRAWAIDRMITLAALAQGLISLYRAGRIAGDEKAFRALYRRATKTWLQSLRTDAS
jgi:AcrR family transcriptional regulator